MENFNEISLNELEEMEEMVCLTSGGTIDCCYYGENNDTTSTDVETNASVGVGGGSASTGTK